MTLRVIECLTEYVCNPIGLDVGRHRLFWKLESERKAAFQAAYRVIVASSRERLDQDEGDMWDSGEVLSDRSIHIEYDGHPIDSGTCCYWKVKVWDAEGNASDWSDTACWSMGLSREDWKAKWIGRKPALIPDSEGQAAPYFRKSFNVTRPVARATVYATALGLYDIRLNGRRVGALFTPGWTDYDVRVQVQAYDITDQIATGDNVFGLILGDGWYAGTVGFLGKGVYGERPFFLMQAKLEYIDGTSELIVSDGSWRTAQGPIIYSDLILGEMYDARRELPGWDRPGYIESDEWVAPDLRAGYNGLLTGTAEPPIRITEVLRPISISMTEAGTYIFDMGQNMVGWTELKVTGPRGCKVTISHAEMLNSDGSLYKDNLRKAIQQDHYILKGDTEERYEPHFTFHGFRYVELIGYPGEPDLDAVVGKVIHSDTPRKGRLETSDTMVNRLYANITWGQRGNFLSVPTDCPQRDERLGWTGDAQIFARTASYNMDVSRFFTKYVQDMIDCQQPSGAFTDVAPDAGWMRHKMWNTNLNWFAPDNAGWGDAGVVIPWTLYLMYGDTRVLADNYDAMVRWVQYLRNQSEDWVRPDYANYGDWLSIDADTPNDVLATAYFAYSTQLLAKIAGVLGRSSDQEKFDTWYTSIAAAFRKAFVREDGRIQGDTQTVYVLALQFGLLTGEQRIQAAQHLADDISSRGDLLSTGFLGVGYLLPALSDSGRMDVAYNLLTQDAFPSWMYSIKHGATTIWERWDGWTEHKGFQTPSMNSFNHYSLGSVGEWMFRYMAGLEADPSEPGFKHAIIRPRPGGGLHWVKASYESLYGKWNVDWNLTKQGVFQLRITVPTNTSATITMPGKLISDPAVEGMDVIDLGSGGTIIRSGSGTYMLECEVGL